LLGILATEPERMGFGTRLADVAPYLPPEATVYEFEGCGHFVHIEQPQRTADLVLEFLAA
ncbi:MAG TPA: alpha/beta hydrolase, partial [Acidimicrobiales bacterium]|nr:alpha/beta hydrolase [Acidimicrobiales bacterium]